MIPGNISYFPKPLASPAEIGQRGLLKLYTQERLFGDKKNHSIFHVEDLTAGNLNSFGGMNMYDGCPKPPLRSSDRPGVRNSLGPSRSTALIHDIDSSTST